MSVENKQIIRKLFKEVLSKGNLTLADVLIAANHVHHDPATPNIGNGPDGQKQIVTLYRTAFPDLQFKIHHMIEADGYVTTRYTATGTHKGVLRGIAPTNKTIKVEGVAINRVSRGRIVESWVLWDALGLMEQLGAVTALEKAKPQAAK
jgi:steroid delta-isomerase-like uncharacterized protein